MSSQFDEITLQINISPGDINYAHLTVPSLVEKHSAIKRRLLVVDCCRPQKTKLVDPDTKFPQEEFNKRVERIIEIALTLRGNGTVNEVYFLKTDDPLIPRLAKKYLRGIVSVTHSAGGTANMSYWAGLELVRTKYILHYDGDILLYQKEGYFWIEEALTYFQENKNIVSATPRLCPPVDDVDFDLPSLHEGRENISTPFYWLNDFLSTRHFLMDKERLKNYFPLLRGKLLLEIILRKYGRRAFPRDPEIVLFRAISSRGGKRLILKSPNAWLTHPVDKPAEFSDYLPSLMEAVDKGKCPEEQKGYENIRMDAWIKFLKGMNTL